MSDAPLALVNGRIRTCDPARPSAEALLILEGSIARLGSSAEITSDLPAGCRTIDLSGRTAVPGFNDCHMHILGLGVTLMAADVSPSAGVTDAGSLIQALRTWADANPHAPWVTGYGYDQNRFPGARHITNGELDRAFPERPVIVFHTSGHAAVANTSALSRSGVGPDTPNPQGGELAHDEAGNLTGLLLETAIGLVTQAMPPLTRAERARAIELACAALVRVGVVAASDMGLGGYSIDDEFGAYLDAVEGGAPVRMTLCPEVADIWEPDGIPEPSLFAAEIGLGGAPATRSDRSGSLRLGALKLYADGALTTRTAALTEPFVDGSGDGMLLHTPDRLQAYVRHGMRRGWQIATHAIGDRAIAEVLDAYEAALPMDHSAGRHRIEHAMLLDPALIQRMTTAGVVAVLQPEFLARLGDAYVLGLGEERASRLNPYRSLLAAGARIAFSSDSPVVPGAPLDGIRAAMHRTTPDGVRLGKDERCTLDEALAAYTTGAAYATRDEARHGAIKPHGSADIVILDDISSDGSFDAAAVAATMVGGRFVHGADVGDG